MQAPGLIIQFTSTSCWEEAVGQTDSTEITGQNALKKWEMMDCQIYKYAVSV